MKPILILLLWLTACSPIYETAKPEYNPNPDLSHIQYSENSGTTKDEAIVILNAKNSNEGIAAEYAYINDKHGERNKGWKFIEQHSYTDDDSGKIFDVLVIEIVESNKTEEIYFDISNFYGKW